MKQRLIFFLASLTFAAPLIAATLTIIATDPQGAPLPGATVQLTVDGVAVARAVTDPGGRAVLDRAPSGGVVHVELDGFRPAITQLAATRITAVVLQPVVFVEEITIAAPRSRVPLAEMSSPVTTIERDELDQTLRTSVSLADALAKSIPGLAPGTGSASIWGQTLRGRGIQVLVDGVPLTTLRNVARDLVAIDPGTIDKIEVLRGTTSLYGDGATGGLINIMTRPAVSGRNRFTTDLTLSGSVQQPSDSMGGRVVQSIAGGAGAFDWRLEVGAERTGSSFDSDGDRRPPDPYGQGGLADTDSLSFLAKGGWALSSSRRLSLSINRYDAEQDTRWTSDPAVNHLPPRSVESRAIEGLQLDHPQGSENTLFQMAYEHRRLFGSDLRALAYGRDYRTVFTAFDGRPFAIYGRQIFQSRLESESIGGRIDVDTPLRLPGLTMYWGADAGSEQTEQPVWIMDPAAFDASGGRTLRTVDDRPWVPLVEKQNQAGFAQLEWVFHERWLLRGGVRHERVQANIPTFSTLAGTTIDGGRRNWSDTLGNVGVVYFLAPGSRLFASFAQGFSLPDIGLILRSAPANASLDTLPFQPQTVDGWDVGWQAERGPLHWSVSAFYSTSDFGTSTAGFNQPVVRAPERVYGTEATIEYRSAARWAAGLLGSWTEGKHDPNRDGVYSWLNNYRIAPPNGTMWVDHATTSRWRNRAQVVHSGDRHRFGGSVAFGERPIESYTVLDFLSFFDLAHGRIHVAVQNALNTKYFVRDAQLLRSGRNDSHTAAPGTTVSIGYSVRY